MKRLMFFVLLPVVHSTLVLANQTLPMRVGTADFFFTRPSEVYKLQGEISSYFNQHYYFSFIKEKDLDANKRNAVAFPIVEVKNLNQIQLDLLFTCNNLFPCSEQLRPTRLHCLVNHDQSGCLKKESEALSYLENNRFLAGNLIRNFTLADWQMAKKTIAGMVIEQPQSKDRFLCYIRPGEVLTLTLSEKIDGNDFVQLSNISFFSPIDEEGERSVGSWKGKAIAVSDAFFEIGEKPLQTNVSLCSTKRESFSIQNQQIKYENGLKKYSSILDLPNFNFQRLCKVREKSNLTVMEFNPSEFRKEVDALREVLEIHGECAGVYLVTKRDKGFHRLAPLFDKKHESFDVAVLNLSGLPEGYKDFVISDHLESQGIPCIQLIQLEKNEALIVDSKRLSGLSLTSCEEFLFRENMREPTNLKKRLHTEVLFVVFKKDSTNDQ